MTRIFKNKILLILMLLGLIKPSGIDNLEKYCGGIWRYISFCLDGLQYFAIIIVALYFTIYIKSKMNISKMTIVISGFQLIYIVSNIINGLSIKNEIKHVVITIVLCMLIEICHKEKMVDHLISAGCDAVGLLVLFNIISVFLFPHGIYIDDIMRDENFFLGYKNRHIYYYIPYIVLQSYSDMFKKGVISKKSIAIYILMTAASVLTKSSTSIVTLFIAVVLIIFYKNKEFKWFTPFKVAVYSAIVTFFIVSMDQIKFLNDILLFLFKKDLTFSARRTIWNAALNLFSQSPIIGNGNTYKIAELTWPDIVQAHNKFLDMMYVGGLVMIVVFFIMIYTISQKTEHFHSTIQRNIFAFCFIGYGFLFLMESAKADVMMFFLFMIVYYSDDLQLPDYEETNEKQIEGRL